MNQEELRQYILRQLGYPMHSIEITELQLDDAIDNAIERFSDRHYNALMQNTYKLDLISGQNTYELPENVRAVIDVIPFSNITCIDQSEKLLLPLNTTFPEYLWQFADIQSIMTHRMSVQTYEKELRFKALQYDFNAPSHRFRIIGSISDIVEKTQSNSLILLVYESANDIAHIYKDRWFKAYASALAKRQWGINLQKYSEIPLPGGTSLNADKIIDQADREIEKLEEQLEDEYHIPPAFSIG